MLETAVNDTVNDNLCQAWCGDVSLLLTWSLSSVEHSMFPKVAARYQHQYYTENTYILHPLEEEKHSTNQFGKKNIRMAGEHKYTRVILLSALNHFQLVTKE